MKTMSMDSCKIKCNFLHGCRLFDVYLAKWIESRALWDSGQHCCLAHILAGKVCLFSLCSLCVHSAFTLRSPCVLPVFSLCSPCVLPVFSLCSPCVLLCSPCVLPVFSLCSPCVLPVFSLCSLCVHCSKTCLSG